MMKFTDPLCRESGNTLVEAVARFAVAAERNDYAGAAAALLALANFADLFAGALSQSAVKAGGYVPPLVRARAERA